MGVATPPGPAWDLLFELAASQAGLFTSAQAAAAGYSAQLLLHHVRNGRVVRAQRGLYRVLHFLPSEEEAAFAAWLWSGGRGVIGGESALALYALTDALPRDVTLWLPEAWRRRRLSAPPNVVVAHADLAQDERAWFGALPITAPARSLNDCARRAAEPDLLREACARAVRRGLVTRSELGDVVRALEPFGGLAP